MPGLQQLLGYDDVPEVDRSPVGLGRIRGVQLARRLRVRRAVALPYSLESCVSHSLAQDVVKSRASRVTGSPNRAPVATRT
ncbi:hypothetical protein ACFW2X_20910 [Streptomyces antibioticus]|uniref:hypothetical protein n=1 Tax=Streptomyces antibioticus TaxID=1890 RepID=UPI00367CBB20